MLLGGDEIARTQGGNNNGWCQDSEISWFDWELDERAHRQLEFTKRLIALRRAHPVFHRRDFLAGEDRAGTGLPDAWWFRPDGRRMTQHDWNSGAHSLGLFLNGDGITAPGPEGERVEDDSFLLLFNASPDDVSFNVPSRRFGRQWSLVFDTADPDEPPAGRRFAAGGPLALTSRSLVLLRRAD
jgi:glycogen operon protein